MLKFLLLLGKHGSMVKRLRHPFHGGNRGSNPLGVILYIKNNGWVPEWSKGADCKSVSDAFEGSNPSPSTNE